MRVLVCGSRTFSDADKMFAELNTGKHGYIDTVIHGAAKGADMLAHDWAATYARQVEVYRADWVREGKAAGVLRNTRMLEYGKPDKVIAFWNGESKGTENMINQARKAGVEVVVVDV